MCDCIEKVNEKIRQAGSTGEVKDRQGRVVIPVVSGCSPLYIKANSLVADYCPLCGKKYPAQKDTTP